MTVTHNSISTWSELLMLPKCVLCVPPNASKANDKSTAAFILDRIARWEAGERLSLWSDLPSCKPHRSSTTKEARISRATTLAREGLDSKACAALTSEGLANNDDSTFTKLQSLHPPGPTAPQPDYSDLQQPPAFDANTIAKALQSFPAGSAPGPTGLRAQHLKDALTPANKSSLLEQLCGLVHLLAPAKPHVSIEQNDMLSK